MNMSKIHHNIPWKIWRPKRNANQPWLNFSLTTVSMNLMALSHWAFSSMFVSLSVLYWMILCSKSDDYDGDDDDGDEVVVASMMCNDELHLRLQWS